MIAGLVNETCLRQEHGGPQGRLSVVTEGLLGYCEVLHRLRQRSTSRVQCRRVEQIAVQHGDHPIDPMVNGYEASKLEQWAIAVVDSEIDEPVVPLPSLLFSVDNQQSGRLATAYVAPLTFGCLQSEK
ncbi:MAG: hypothetical protein WBW80_06595 [Acidimicrobiales bacterium]